MFARYAYAEVTGPGRAHKNWTQNRETIMASDYPFPAKGGIEPSLAELLDDPTLNALLKCDGLSTEDVLGVIAEWRKLRRSQDLALPAAA